jgi:hypothetical protein
MSSKTHALADETIEIRGIDLGVAAILAQIVDTEIIG